MGSSISAVFRNGVVALLDFETILGLSNVTSYNFTAGVRIEFQRRGGAADERRA